MSEEQDDNNLGEKPKKTLSLRGGGLSQGTVKQNFSHGRSKAVVVETRKRRINKPGETPKPKAVEPAPVAVPEVKPKATPEIAEAASNLSNSEMEARRRALEEANSRQDQDKLEANQKEAERADLDSRRKADRDDKKRREEDTAKRETEEREAAEREAAAVASAASVAADPDALKKRDNVRDEAKPKVLKPFERKKSEEAAKPSRTKGDDNRRRTKLTLTNALDERGNRGPSLAALRRRQEKAKRMALGQTGPREKISREVQLPETITIQELAARMTERSVDVIKYLMKEGQMLTPGDVIDADMAELITAEFGHTVRRVSESDVEEGLFYAPMMVQTWFQGRLLSPSWATLITVKLLCWTRFATPKW